MDFSNMPNLKAKEQELKCNSKAGLFGKGSLQKAERSWLQFSPEELAQIEEDAGKVHVVGTAFPTRHAIVYAQGKHLRAIPVRDVIWVYPKVTTHRTNFIPTSKTFELVVVTRNSDTIPISVISKGPMCKEDPNLELLKYLASVIVPVRPGVIFGYSDQVQAFYAKRFQDLCHAVDAKSVK